MGCCLKDVGTTTMHARLGVCMMAVLVLVCFSSSLSAANRGRDNTREALIKLDSGVEAKAEVTGPSEQTKKEVERQKLQREARKKRQKENREKRQKRLDEMNSRIRRKDMKNALASRFWLILLGVVMLIGCIFAFNDLSIIFVSYFGGYFGMDVDSFVKARRKLTRTNVNSAGVWINALVSLAKSIIGGGGGGWVGQCQGRKAVTISPGESGAQTCICLLQRALDKELLLASGAE